MRMMDSPQFAPTFCEEVVAGRRKFVKNHRFIGWIAYPVSFVMIGAWRLFMLFWLHVKKLSGIALVAAAFAASSSFAFPVLTMRAGFVSLDVDRTALRAQAAAYSTIPATEVLPSDAQMTEAGAEEASATAAQAKVLTETAADSAVDFAAGIDESALADPSLLDDGLDEEDRYHSESGSDITLGDVDSLTKLLEANDEAWAAMDEDEGQSGENGFDAEDWRLILVNKQHPIPADYEFELAYFNGAMQCDSRIVGNMLEMFRGALSDGISLIPCSPYRTHDHQIELFDRKIDRYMAGGLSYMDAYTRAAQAVTVPGTSEHEIGLAIDIVTSGYTSLNEGFGRTQAGKWLAAHSADYGFILRYPKGKESITGIEFEPWHFRYVGKEAAQRIAEEGICLEEFWDAYLYH